MKTRAYRIFASSLLLAYLSFLPWLYPGKPQTIYIQRVLVVQPLTPVELVHQAMNFGPI
jgi:hypothetical protein